MILAKKLKAYSCIHSKKSKAESQINFKPHLAYTYSIHILTINMLITFFFDNPDNI